MKPNAFIVNSSRAYELLFKELGFNIVHNNVAVKPDLYVFTGGEDVTPSLYGAKKHPYTGNSVTRDEYETEMFKDALMDQVPCVGICRGGQFLNVMSGGAMYQHVSSHTQSHHITDVLTGDVVYVSSTHHQMMKPGPGALLVASSALGGTREWFDGEIAKRDVSEQDIEVVFYKDTQSLCFQPHPEFTGAEYIGMREYFRSLLDRHFQFQLEAPVLELA
jgi:GMP synthase-like glutamine amidotransferase